MKTSPSLVTSLLFLNLVLALAFAQAASQAGQPWARESTLAGVSCHRRTVYKQNTSQF